METFEKMRQKKNTWWCNLRLGDFDSDKKMRKLRQKNPPCGVIQRPPLILRTNVEKPKHGTNLRECVLFPFQAIYFGSFELFV